MHKFSLIVCTLGLLVMSHSGASAEPTKVGMLTCMTSASLGLIIGSHQKLSCRFTPNSGGVSETYTGTINRLGLDLGFTAGGIMAWAVFAPTNGISPRALVGKYVGGSGDISLGAGVGANALVGGSRRSVALQPVSLEAQVGVNLALGVAGLTLN
jgi:hypothetical protein